MVTVISRFRVRNGVEAEVRSAFINRPRLVEKTVGFCGLDVLTDAADPSVFLLLTRWTNEERFRTWHRSEGHHQSHELMPRGLKLDASFTSLTVGNRIEDPAGVRNLGDAIEGQTVALSQWLMESDAVYALLLLPDGTILMRNRASERVFSPDPAKNTGSSIWDYLICSDAQHLRQRLLEPGDPNDGYLLVNLADGRQNPITLEVGLVRCNGAVLLLATQERLRDAQLQSENFRLTNDLSILARDSARKNRELLAANETIERLARTDALTGLANRRMLDESFPREIALAERLNGHFSVVLADFDDFKSINDQFGHMAGDQVLTRVAAVFASQLRAYDLAARYGGDEFILLLPGSSEEEAMGIADRIRKEVADLKVADCSRQITVSLGVASWRAGETPADLIAHADAALYHAKNTGNNKVEAASGNIL